MIGDVFSDRHSSPTPFGRCLNATAEVEATVNATIAPRNIETTKTMDFSLATSEKADFFEKTNNASIAAVEHEIIPAIRPIDITPVPSPVPPHSENCESRFCPICVKDCMMNIDDVYDNLPTPSIMTDVSTVITPTHTASRKKTYKTDIGKKRLKHKNNWTVVQRKKLKNEGKAYENYKGKQITEKSLGETCGITCRYKCTENIDANHREKIFTKFWGLGDRKKHWEFVIKYSKKVPKGRKTTENIKHKRENTFIYYLPNSEKEPKRVCRKMFLSTISSGERIVTTAWKKYDGEIAVADDNRGKYEHKPRVIDDMMVQSVKDHVNSIDRVESHYTRKDTKKLYLNNIISTAQMFRLYTEWCEWYPDKYTNKANKRQYRDIVNANFNIAFHLPKKDRCDICHVFDNNEFPNEEEKQRFLEHQEHKKKARALKNSDKVDGSKDEKLVVATFDFQKVLQTPHGEVSTFYYKRKLNAFNFTIYDINKKAATCYMWNEVIAKKGANEVSSCLYAFIKENAEKGVDKFRFWSDNCAGQNRNRIVFALYLLAAKEYGVSIIHRFMEKGHTQNEGDSVHAMIERASERKFIYVPDEWNVLVRWSKTEGEPYAVKEMNKDDFFDFKGLLDNKNWTKDLTNQVMRWNQIREVKVNANAYDRIEYKYDLGEEPKTLVVLRTGKRNNQRNQRHFELNEAYRDGCISIPYEKYKDLNSMCKSLAIPRKYHSFYKNLPHAPPKTRQDLSCLVSDGDDSDID